jgi:hypothetical protein
MREKTPEERAAEVVMPLVPTDAESRVGRSYRQWNQVIREHIRTETGLRLSDGDSRFSIPVRVDGGMPAQLASLILAHPDPVAWRLVTGQPKLAGLVGGLTFLLEHWAHFEKWPSLPPAALNARPTLESCLDIASSLHRLASAEQTRGQIKAIEADILGAYQFSGQHAPSVALYWIPIAMVAAMLDVSIEDLAAVVLIHELSHGYTHLGRDIDGTQWDDSAFGRSELAVTEGLAQFYTELVSATLGSRAPGMTVAYERLLDLQSDVYRVHRDWLNGDNRRRGERVRYALIAARSHSPIRHETWLQLMDDAKHALA